MRAMKLRVVLLALAGLALAVAGCMSTSRGRALETRVDKLTSDNEQLTAQLKDVQEKLAATVPKIDAKIAEVAKALDSLDRASRRSGADAPVQLEKPIAHRALRRGRVV